jgi:hypothetical protein
MRNCECIGNPAMFQSRVMGVGVVFPISEPRENWGKLAQEAARRESIIADYQQKLGIWKTGLAAAQAKCPPIDPDIRYTNPIICTPAAEYIDKNPMPVEPPRIGPIPLDYTPFPTKGTSPTPTPGSAAPTAFSLPLLLGAAYLLLS